MSEEKSKFSVSDKVKVGLVVGVIGIAIIVNQVLYNTSAPPMDTITPEPQKGSQQIIDNNIAKQQAELERQKKLQELNVEKESELTLDSLLPDGTNIMVVSPSPEAVGKGSLTYLITKGKTDTRHEITWQGNSFAYATPTSTDPLYLSSMFASYLLNRDSVQLGSLKSYIDAELLKYTSDPSMLVVKDKTMTSMSFSLRESQLVVDYILADHVDGTDDEIFVDMGVYLEFKGNKWIITDVDIRKEGDQFGI